MLTEDEIIQILRLIEESHFDEMHLEMGDLKLTVSRRGHTVSAPPGPNKAIGVVPAIAAAPGPSAPEIATKSWEEEGTRKDIAVAEQALVPIKAPMVGVFYAAPEPGAPPYVTVGSHVKPDDTVCLLEVMKVFNAVKAEMYGQIARICVENGQLVEYGQVLFLVRPDTAG